MNFETFKFSCLLNFVLLTDAEEEGARFVNYSES